MGSELSCPCGNRNDVETVPTKEKVDDIVQELLKSKLSEDDLQFQYIYDQSKICLIRGDQFEPFFANRNFLKTSTKKEINYYYNLIHISNFSFEKNLLFIFLQYTPGMEDKSMIRNTLNTSRTKKNNKASFDYKTNYKIETINLVSNDKKKVSEQILNDINSNLKKDFIFYGLIKNLDDQFDRINTNQNNLTTSTGLNRTYKFLYKRSLLKEVIDCRYSIETFEGKLTRDILNEILSEEANTKKLLKSIVCDSNLSLCTSVSKSINFDSKNYYFIYEENLNMPQNYVYLVVEMVQGSTPEKIFLQDITVKLNDYQNDYKLCCFVGDEKKFFIIFAADLEALDLETPFSD